MQSRAPSESGTQVYGGLVIFVVALAVRLLHLYFFRSTIFFEEPIFDEIFYHEEATAIAAGNWLGHKVHFMGPLYSYFLGLLYAVSGGSRLFALIAQSVLGAGTCVLTWLVAREVFSAKAAFAAGVIASLYGVLIFYDGLLLMETLVLFLNMLSLLLLTRGMRTGRLLYVFAAGLCIGLSALGRASVLVFALGAILLVLWRFPRALKRRALAGALLAAAVLAVLAPVTVRNYGIERDLTLVSANGGLNFYIGNGPGATGTFRILTDSGVAPGDMTGRFQAEIMAGRRLTMAETSRWWYGLTLDHIEARPWLFVNNFFWKVRLFWNSYEIPQIEWYDATRVYSPVLALPLVTSMLIIPFALLGVAAGVRKWRIMPVLFLYVAAQTVAFSAFFITARYRLTVLPVLAVFAAYGVVWLFGAIWQRRFGAALLSVLVLALLFWLTGPGWLNLNMEELNKWYSMNLGLRYGATEAGVEKGVELIGAAAREFPGDPDARNYHGIVLRRAGRHGEALAEFEAAAALRPEDAVFPFQIGKTYGEMGEDSLAAEAFTRAISIAPLYEDAYKHLAFAYSRQGRYADAAAEFEKAVMMNSTDSSLRLNLGVTYGILGRTSDAIREFENAVHFDRANWKARYNLAVALVEVGRVEEARRQLEAIVGTDPGNEAARSALAELDGAVR
jgi:tetratricopeptide (TPR) repeat protein